MTVLKKSFRITSSVLLYHLRFIVFVNFGVDMFVYSIHNHLAILKKSEKASKRKQRSHRIRQKDEFRLLKPHTLVRDNTQKQPC